jgi:TRAP-type C4-dicarboxylate transport system permease large subunit
MHKIGYHILPPFFFGDVVPLLLITYDMMVCLTWLASNKTTTTEPFYCGWTERFAGVNCILWTFLAHLSIPLGLDISLANVVLCRFSGPNCAPTELCLWFLVG